MNEILRNWYSPKNKLGAKLKRVNEKNNKTDA